MLTHYRVGRASLREALRILEVDGLVAIRPGPGGGPVFAGVSSGSFGRKATLFFQVAGATFSELVQARLVLEPVMARLAAEGQDRAQLAELEASLTQAKAVQLADNRRYLQVSTDFHSLVTGMSGNRILDLTARGIKDVYTQRLREMAFPAEDRKKVLRDHEAIGRAIIRGEGARAERLMRTHMEAYARSVARLYPGLMNTTVGWG
jgi:DNA-binding FadR family transcriptional regulator